MAKFALECPHCGTVNKASTMFFAKKTVVCGNCKAEIDVKSNRMAIGNCPTCGSVAFDRAKGKCPVCKSKISLDGKATSVEELKDAANTPLFECPDCGCFIQASKQAGGLVCPVCDRKFNGYEEVFKQIQKAKLVTDMGVSVIKYEGDNNVFVWKHPIEDFNLGTQLIVHEAQEAIFFLNGQALDTFGPGKYTLETENLPILQKIYKLPTGRQNPFHAEVYFINKTVQMGLKWGTDSKVNFIEPQSGISMKIGASGEMNLQVTNGRTLITSLVGTTKGIAWNSERADFARSLNMAFRPLLMQTVKANLSSAIQSQKINILEIDAHLEELSATLGTKVSEGFNEFGLSVNNFFITNVVLPEEDPNFRQMKDLIAKAYLGVRSQEVEADIKVAERQRIHEEKETELMQAEYAAKQQLIKAQAEAEALKLKGVAEAEVMAAKGYSQKDVLQADVQKAYAEGIGNMGSSGGGNGGGGGIMSDILGLSVGMAAMGTMSDKVTSAMQGMNSPAEVQKPADGWTCPNCGNTGISGKFCSECGAQKPAPANSWICTCGASVTGNFCSNCGAQKPAPVGTWDCACGKKGITGNFCSNCGAQKPAPAEKWDCSCGKTGIDGKFCSNCGKTKGE